MSRQLAQRATKPTLTFSAPMRAVLQRKCDCGLHTPGGGTCTRCAAEGNPLQRKLTIGASNDPLEWEADRVADEVARSSPRPLLAPRLLGRATRDDTADGVPASVHNVLGSAGEPLNAAARADMEQRFGRDFSRVRVHHDSSAVESARDVGARAYTVGSHIVFGAGQFTPNSEGGRHLLAHELTHVVQQSGAADRVQKSDANELDDRARAIISAAKDASQPLAARAVAAVKAIVATYYDSSLVDSVVYDESDQGLTTSPVGQGQAIKGRITVGKYFVENIDKFARRVIQVGHELQHVQQQRQGMGGPENRNEREFLAHSWASNQEEKPGTGRMAHSNRVAMIDEALKNYYCMDGEKQKKHKANKDALLTLRTSEETKSGRPHTDPPTGCASASTTPKSDPTKSDAGKKTVTTHPEPQKIEMEAALGGEVETKSDAGKRETEGSGKFSFELVIPITDKLRIGPLSFLPEAGTEFNLGVKSGPTFTLGAEATLKMVSLEFDKIKTPLGLVDVGLSGSAIAGAEYQRRDSSAAFKLGLSSEVEVKLNPVKDSSFFIKVTGGAEKTYGKEGRAEWHWGPVTWTGGVSAGFNIP